MKLKNLYSLSIIGVVLFSFSAGWLALSQVSGLPLSYLSAVGIVIGFAGLVIMIKTLSTISKIELKIEGE